MDDRKLLEKFVAKCPFAVLVQTAMRGVIRDEFEKLFEKYRSRQYSKTLSFSATAIAVADVVLRFSQNFRQAFTQHKESLLVSLTSFYNKINSMELAVSEAIVAHSAQRAAELQDNLAFGVREVLKGYKVYAFDGNHLQEAEKRLKPLRMLHDAPLAGTIVARFDLQRCLFDRAYLLEDAHAQESTTLDRIIDDLELGDLFIADRHYCVIPALRKADEKKVCFVVRQHGRFKGVLIGERRQIGRTETGMVYEQIIHSSKRPDALVMRRITVELDKPTRDGDRNIHVLTNLPAEVDAQTIADLYRLRWEEETGYYYLTTTLTCELPSVGHPQAALFLFCMAMMAFNTRQVVFASLYAEHDKEAVDNVSHHALSVETARFTDGMLVALDDAFWERLIGDGIEQLVSLLRELSRRIDLTKYRKRPRGPKVKVEKPPHTRPKTHVSIAKVLKEAPKKRP